MSFLRRLLGRTGEDRAARHLTRRGYRVLERNYRTRQGEIDIIALHEGTLVFIEVKTRASESFGAPESAVNRRKQERMIKAALAYLSRKDLHQVPCRFDVVAVRQGARDAAVDVIQNAFGMDPMRG